MSWKLKDDRRFFPGVPMRDLTDAEMDAAEALFPGIKDVEPPVYEYSDDAAHPTIAKRIAEVAEASATGAGPKVAPVQEPEPDTTSAPTWPQTPQIPGVPGGPPVLTTVNTDDSTESSDESTGRRRKSDGE